MTDEQEQPADEATPEDQAADASEDAAEDEDEADDETEADLNLLDEDALRAKAAELGAAVQGAKADLVANIMAKQAERKAARDADDEDLPGEPAPA